MPNHCRNRMTIHGPVEDVAAFVKKANGLSQSYGGQAGRMKILSFHQIVPIPDSVLAGEYDPGGYNAECNLWGAKWGAYEDEIESHECCDATKTGVAVYTFTTAWTVADTFFITASELYPTLVFYLSLAEESPSRGRYIFANGDSPSLPSYEGQDAWLERRKAELRESDPARVLEEFDTEENNEEREMKLRHEWNYELVSTHDEWVEEQQAERAEEMT